MTMVIIYLLHLREESEWRNQRCGFAEEKSHGSHGRGRKELFFVVPKIKGWHHTFVHFCLSLRVDFKCNLLHYEVTQHPIFHRQHQFAIFPPPTLQHDPPPPATPCSSNCPFPPPPPIPPLKSYLPLLPLPLPLLRLHPLFLLPLHAPPQHPSPLSLPITIFAILRLPSLSPPPPSLHYFSQLLHLSFVIQYVHFSFFFAQPSSWDPLPCFEVWYPLGRLCRHSFVRLLL